MNIYCYAFFPRTPRHLLSPFFLTTAVANELIQFYMCTMQLEKMNESHVDFMACQLRSFNIQTTPLMVATEVKTPFFFFCFLIIFLLSLLFSNWFVFLSCSLRSCTRWRSYWIASTSTSNHQWMTTSAASNSVSSYWLFPPFSQFSRIKQNWINR